MAAAPVVPPQETAAPLSEPARVINTFIAPRKTFSDLKRSASWWLPFFITAIISVAFVYVVDQKIGLRKVMENQIHSQPKQEARLESLPPDQREKALQQQLGISKVISYGFFVFALIWFVIVAAVLLATLKFGFGAEVEFKTLFALVMFASLPGIIKALLAMLSVAAGAASDSFTFQNPLATNPGYFVDAATNPVLHSFLTSFDVFTIWTLVLAAIGITCVSKVKAGAAYAIVFGWYAVVILLGVGVTALFA